MGGQQDHSFTHVQPVNTAGGAAAPAQTPDGAAAHKSDDEVPPAAVGVAHAFDTQLLPWVEEAIEQLGLLDPHRPHPAALVQRLECRAGRHGWSLFSRVALDQNETIMVIPKARLLRDRSRGKSGLAWAVAKNYMQGKPHSRLAAYLSVLPDTHTERPARWDAAFLREHLEGSGFPEYVAEEEEQVQADFASLQVVHEHCSGRTPTWDEYLWAYDTVATRAMQADTSNHWMLFPVGDMCNHGDRPNVAMRWRTVPTSSGRESEELFMTAARRVETGDELTTGYVDFGRLSNWQSLQLWGFASPRTRAARMVVRLRVTAPQASAAIAEALGIAAPGRDFCADEGSGPELCRRKFFLLGGAALEEDDGLFGQARAAVRNDAPTATWDQEAAAMMVCRLLMTAALAAYPHSVEQDDELLDSLAAGADPDPRVGVLIQLRRDEKSVLHQWRKRAGFAEQYAREASGPLDLGYLHLAENCSVGSQ
jgi:hypothetical protein